MTCPSCRNAIPDGARFCPSCGAPAPTPVGVGTYTEPVPESANPNRFTGPGRLGLQSMTYHEPATEGAQQQGGQSNIGGVLGSLFNPRQ